MTISGSRDKQLRSARVDREKSMDEIFEHVIRGVRLSRLRELLRGGRERHSHSEQGDAWANSPEPTTA